MKKRSSTAVEQALKLIEDANLDADEKAAAFSELAERATKTARKKKGGQAAKLWSTTLKCDMLAKMFEKHSDTIKPEERQKRMDVIAELRKYVQLERTEVKSERDGEFESVTFTSTFSVKDQHFLAEFIFEVSPDEQNRITITHKASGKHIEYSTHCSRGRLTDMNGACAAINAALHTSLPIHTLVVFLFECSGVASESLQANTSYGTVWHPTDDFWRAVTAPYTHDGLSQAQ